MAQRAVQIAQEIAGFREDLTKDWTELMVIWDHLRRSRDDFRPVLEIVSGAWRSGRPVRIGFLSALCLLVATVALFWFRSSRQSPGRGE